MSGITWLHLSDWHQRGKDFNRQVVRDALLEDLRNRMAISTNLARIDFIIFSGDVAFSGQKEEYDAVIEYLFKPVLNATGLTPDQLFIVPGNHDLDRNQFELLPSALLAPFMSEEQVQEWLLNKKKRDRLLEPFEAFNEFVSTYTGQEQAAYTSVRQLEINDKQVALLGLNSALMCGRNKDTQNAINDYGYLVVGEPQLHDAMKQISEADLRIAVVHHPFSWLANFDRLRIEERLGQVFHFILHGHEHLPKVNILKGTEGNCVVIPAGASYERRVIQDTRYVNAYNLVHLDLEAEQGTVYLRKWSDRRNHWLSDIDTYRDGFFPFHFPKKQVDLVPSNVSSTEPMIDISSTLSREEWGEAPDIRTFYGREHELANLENCVVKNHCRLVVVLGLGGIGKTSLVSRFATKIRNEFDSIFWRSLQNAPPLEEILEKAIIFFSNQQQINFPKGLDDQISLLIEYFRKHRCLLVLDNLETILQSGDYTGLWREGYEGYGRLIQRIGAVQHQSCILITSREKPNELGYLGRNESLVHLLLLTGLGKIEGYEILKNEGLFGSDEAWTSLIHRYSGNPLALKLISEPTRELFGGNISKFLEGEEMIVGNIFDLLAQQFKRLTNLEQHLMYWLAIEREAISLEELFEDLANSVSRRELITALESLSRRSMIESSDLALFTLQPLILEFVTDLFVEHIYKEINTERLVLFISHALIKAQAKDYVRKSQTRLILTPLAHLLLTNFGKTESANKFRSILTFLRHNHVALPNYAAGNILNLLIQLQYDLSDYNFSHLTIWQAYLQGVSLQDVSFAHSNFSKSVFTETFGDVLSVAFSPDGKLIAAGTARSEIRIWQALGTIPLNTFQGHTDWVRSVAFSPDGNTLASGSDDQTIRLWDVSSGHHLRTLQGHKNQIWSVSFSPDGKTVASGSADQTIRLWEVSSGLCLNTFQGHTDWVRSVAFSPDGNTLASGSDDQTIKIWDVKTGRCFNTLQASHSSRIRSVAFSPNGMTIANCTENQIILLWDVNTGQCLQTLLGHANQVWSVSFSPDGNTLASGSDDQTIRLWEVKSGQCLNTLAGHTNRVWSVSFSPDGNTLVSGSEDQTIRLWEVKSGQCLNTRIGYTNRVWSVAFKPKSNVLAAGCDDQAIRLWNTNTSKCFKVLQGHCCWLSSITFSPNGYILASGSDNHTVRLWDVNTGQCLNTLQGHTGWVRSVAFNLDGNILASGSEDHTIRLWEVSTGYCLQTLQGHANPVWSVSFSPDGNTLASGGDDHTIRLWEISSGRCLNIFQGETDWISSVSFSSDGRILASGSEDGTIKLWEVSSGNCLNILRGHTGWVRSISFSSDGRILASGSEDGTIKLWEVGSSDCINTLKGHNTWIWTVTFSSDGRILASGSEDGSIKLWDMQLGKCIKTLHSDRPYERMKIDDVKGLTEAQKITLKILGAIEHEK